MARIAGIDLPKNKRIEIALTRHRIGLREGTAATYDWFARQSERGQPTARVAAAAD